jgi:mRNA interferase MazF
VLADAGRGDWILCQVTSNPYADPSAVMLAEDCFQEGTLSRVSYARPGKLFTASDELFVSRVGKLNQSVLKRLVGEVVQILNGDFAKE